MDVICKRPTPLTAAMSDHFDYSERYYDEQYEYRHVTMPKGLVNRVPLARLMREPEWRALGVCQSAGWVHYAIHRPERHILLFKRPKGYSELNALDKAQWTREAQSIISDGSNELQRALAPRTRNSTRQVLKESNVGKTNGTTIPQTEDGPMGAHPDLFY